MPPASPESVRSFGSAARTAPRSVRPEQRARARRRRRLHRTAGRARAGDIRPGPGRIVHDAPAFVERMQDPRKQRRGSLAVAPGAGSGQRRFAQRGAIDRARIAFAKSRRTFAPARAARKGTHQHVATPTQERKRGGDYTEADHRFDRCARPARGRSREAARVRVRPTRIAAGRTTRPAPAAPERRPHTAGRRRSRARRRAGRRGPASVHRRPFRARSSARRRPNRTLRDARGCRRRKSR